MKKLNHNQRNTSAVLLPTRHISDLGWGFIVAWGISIIFTGTFTHDDASNLGVFWFTSMLGAPVGLLAFFFLKDPLSNRKMRDMLHLLALAGMVVGTAMLALSLYSDEALSVALQIIGGIVSSLGTAVYTILWGTYYTSLDMQRIERSAAYSLILAFACYACVLVLPEPFAIVLIACFPFFSTLFLRGGEGSSGQGAETDGTRSPSHFNVRSFVRIGLGVVGATATISLFWSMVNNGTVPLPHTLFEASVLSGTAVAVLLMVYMTRFSRSLNLGTLYRWVLPLVAAAFALLFMPGTISVLVACLLAFAAQALLNLLTFVYFAELAKRTNAPPYRVFGLGRFFLEVGFLIGIVVTPAAMLFVDATGSYHGVFAIALAILIVLVMSSVAIQDRLAFTLEDRENTPSTSGTDALEAACDTVGMRYRMTNREREILAYLAQGYSLPYIRNELYIAQSTIDTHVRHIYKKMGIHSKEELITEVRDTME
ncbi:response regulator transcription factor [Raoultibacter phocaeensis]|uniref:response regulator transcription factor n=1 Tax=Raoultibacter phocaeensis TaxID=2479841 RepID=UPI0015D60354|nr:helix-turn-helix transcriptional regulator [Raoultibacter phocaeensis]